MQPNKSSTYTYKDSQTWDGRWELLDGTPFNMTPAPSWGHQYTVGELHFALRNFFSNKDCFVAVSPFDVFLTEEDNIDNSQDVVQPDLSVICDRKKLSKQGCIGAPDLVIEVLSPSTALKDRNEKYKKYQHCGVQEYWIVDPTYKIVEVYGKEAGYFRKKEAFGEGQNLQSYLFPELKINISSLFTE